MKRKIIHIDRDKCTGCGLCIPNCAEGSLEIRDGKAVLVRDALCDGLGACLGHCPEGALQIEEREAEAFDEELVHAHLADAHPDASDAAAPSGCPSAEATSLGPHPSRVEAAESPGAGSELQHWPVQLKLLPPSAPFLRDTELLLAADCTAFAYGAFHRDFLRGRSVAVACPKLDNPGEHFQKLIQIFRQGGLTGVTLVRMEVPCCGGLTRMAQDAMAESGADIPLWEVVIRRDGTAGPRVRLAAPVAA